MYKNHFGPLILIKKIGEVNKKFIVLTQDFLDKEGINQR